MPASGPPTTDEPWEQPATSAPNSAATNIAGRLRSDRVVMAATLPQMPRPAEGHARRTGPARRVQRRVGSQPRVVPPEGATFATTPLADVPVGSFMYFVHSFHAVTLDPAATIAVAAYGEPAVTAAIARDNVLGCQFHPEKSGKNGLSLLSRFIAS